MSTKKEVFNAISELENRDLTIMHCNSSYPAEDNQLDLKLIQIYKKLYPHYKIGYSGHENGIQPSIIAKSLGAEVIERHITLDKNMWGTDHKASLEYKELKELIQNLKMVDLWLGEDKIKIYPEEKKIRNKLRVG